MSNRLFGPTRGIADSPWGPSGAILLVLAASLVAAALAGLVLGGIVFTSPATRQAIQTGCAGDARSHCVAAGLGFLNLVYLLLVAGLVVACRLRRGATLANSLLLRSPGWRWWQYAAFAVTTVFALLVLQQVLMYLTGQLGGDPGDVMRDLEEFRKTFQPLNPVTAGLLVMLAVVLAPLAEEFVFRGILFAALQKRLGVLASALILSGVWSVLHWGYSSQNLIALFALGILFAYIVWRTGSLFPAIFGHAANNLVAVVVLFAYEPQVTGT